MFITSFKLSQKTKSNYFVVKFKAQKSCLSGIVLGKDQLLERIMLFNPPYSMNIKSKIAHNFLKQIDKHFPESCTLHKIFNRNTVKISYSCMDNMKTMITKHNSRILNKNENRKLQRTDNCNCRRKEQCPLQGNCLTNNIVYRADVTTTDTRETKQYIGMTANSSKERYRNHIKSIEDRKYSNETELSKYIWDLKSKNQSFSIKWTIVKRAAAYTSGAKRYNLCLQEKLCIMKARLKILLNKRSEIVSKCRHRNRFLISKTSHARTIAMSHPTYANHDVNEQRKRRQ